MTFYNSTNNETLKTVEMASLSMYQQKDKFEWNATVSSNQTSFTITNSTGNVTDVNSHKPSPAFVALCYISDTDGKNYQTFLD